MRATQTYLDLLGREADPATGRRMVFGRLPIRPREADLLAAIAELATDHVTYVGTRQRIADAVGVSTRSVDRYVSALATSGYLARSRQGNGVRLAIDVAAVVDGPQVETGCDTGRQTVEATSAPKGQGCDKSGQTRQTTAVPSRRDLGRQLVATIVQAGSLAIALLFYSRHCRRAKTPVKAVRSGDAWQGLLFADDGPVVTVSAPKPARKVATAGLDKMRQESPSPHVNVNDLMLHEAKAAEDIKPARPPANSSGGWPCRITAQVLRDPDKVDSLYQHAVRRGWIKDSEATQRGFAAVAEQAAAKGREPGKLFTTLVKRRAWEQDAKDGGVTQWAEEKAQQRRRSKPTRATVPLPYLRDPDEAASASRDDQARRLQERYGVAAQPTPGMRTAEAVAT